jgi:hypothetical protein
MITKDFLLERINARPQLLAAEFFLHLAPKVQDILSLHLMNPASSVTMLTEMFIDYGYTHSSASVRTFFYYIHSIEPENNRTKERPLKVDIFRASLTPDQDESLMEILELPNPSIDTVINYLKQYGYEGSWTSVRNWYLRAKKKGEKAQRLNMLVETYKGVDQNSILYKLLVDSLEQLDRMREVLDMDESDLSAKEVLKVYPAVAREVRSCVEALEKKEQLADFASAEKNGAMYVVEKLLETFKDQPAFYDPIKIVCDGIMTEITTRTRT